MALEFTLIIILQALGVAFSAGKKILQLDKKCPDDTLDDVIQMFWKEDRVTIFISGLIVIFDIVVHLIISVYAPSVRDISVPIPMSKVLSFLPDFSIPYLIISFGIAFFLGYGGQSFFYKVFGKLEKKVTDNLKLDE